MSEVLHELDGRAIARDVAVRAKALRALRESRRPARVLRMAPLIAIPVVVFALSGFRADLWTKTVISVACILAFSSVAMDWRFRRQLSAITDLLLLDEPKSG